jgi:hypothetical protein
MTPSLGNPLLEVIKGKALYAVGAASCMFVNTLDYSWIICCCVPMRAKEW